jgi:chaperonin GroEL
VISEEVGMTLEKADPARLGQAKSIESAKRTPPSSTVQATADIEARVKQIRVQIEEATSDYDAKSCKSVLQNSPAVLP